MIFCFNELCMNAKTIKSLNKECWNNVLKQFTDILKHAGLSNGPNLQVRTENGLWNIISKYTLLHEVINENRNKDRKRLILRLEDKSPYWEKEKEVFKFNGVLAVGFSAAYYHDCPAISFNFPDTEKAPIVKISSGEDLNLKKIFNFTNEGQFELYNKFYRSADHCQSYILSLDNLKSKAKEHEYWERLVFSDEFQKLEIEKKYISAIINKLCILNNFLFADTINSLSFNDLRNVLPDARDESGSVRNDKNKMESRTKSFAGEGVACLLHTNLDKSYRLYFKVEYQQRLIYIGYIGKHLDTGRYKGN